MKRYRRSVSQLNQYTRCSEQYRLSRLLRSELPYRPAAWLVVGSAFHEAYEEWERAGRSGSIVDLYGEHFERILAEEAVKQPDYDLWITAPRVKSVERDIELRREAGAAQSVMYEEHCRDVDWKVATIDGDLAIEVPFEIDVGVPLVGKIDLVIEWPDGRRTVRDHKTGNKGEVQSNRQLGTYRLALWEQYGISLRYGEYWYTKLNDSGGWVDLTRYDRPYLADQYIKLDDAIQQNIFLPNPGPNCMLCDVSKYCREMGSDPR